MFTTAMRGAIISALLGLAVLVGTIGLIHASDVNLAGDVDCDGVVNPVDSLKILRHDSGLSVSQPLGCPSIGSAVGGPTPVPTPTYPSGYQVTFPGFYADPENFEGTVTSTITVSTIPGGIHDDVTAPAGSRFAIVFMNVENFGNEPDFISEFSFRLVDSIDRSFTMDFDNDTNARGNAKDFYDRQGAYETLQPGIPTDMVFVFQVPLDATDLMVSRCPEDGSAC